jgi:hypothetical protein
MRQGAAAGSASMIGKTVLLGANSAPQNAACVTAKATVQLTVQIRFL